MYCFVLLDLTKILVACFLQLLRTLTCLLSRGWRVSDVIQGILRFRNSARNGKNDSMGHQSLLSFLCHTPQTSLWNNNLETLNYWSLGKQLILFPENLRDSREAKLTVSRRTTLFKNDLLYSWKFIKPRCNGGCLSIFAVTVHCYPLTLQILQFCPIRNLGGKQFHC